MKTTLTISAFLLMTITATLTDARSFQVGGISHKQEELCDEGRLSELAGCGCYVQATVLDAPNKELGLCQEQFGEDLLSLKSHCKDFKKGDDVDVKALAKAIAQVQKICLPELMGSSRISEDGNVDLEHSERILPYVVLAIIAFYPTKAY